MKLLHVEIRECRECPYFGSRVNKNFGLVDEAYCRHERLAPGAGAMGWDYLATFPIPDWCPLPDAKEEPKCRVCGNTVNGVDDAYITTATGIAHFDCFFAKEEEK